MILLALSLFAATGQASNATTKPADADGRIVCKRIQRTGSRLAPKRVCLSAYEWQQMELRSRREVSDIQRRSQPESSPRF